MPNAVELFGAISVARLPSAANSENATVVKTTPGRFYHINGHNAAAAVRYIKLYDQATTPSETDTPFLTFACQASVPFQFSFASPVQFTTGIAYRMVTGAADNNDTALTAGDILGFNLAYS